MYYGSSHPSLFVFVGPSDMLRTTIPTPGCTILGVWGSGSPVAEDM